MIMAIYETNCQYTVARIFKDGTYKVHSNIPFSLGRREAFTRALGEAEFVTEGNEILFMPYEEKEYFPVKKWQEEMVWIKGEWRKR